MLQHLLSLVRKCIQLCTKNGMSYSMKQSRSSLLSSLSLLWTGIVSSTVQTCFSCLSVWALCARDKLCFGVSFWCALLCMGLINKANSANRKTSCVFLTQLYENTWVIMYSLSGRGGFQNHIYRGVFWKLTSYFTSQVLDWEVVIQDDKVSLWSTQQLNSHVMHKSYFRHAPLQEHLRALASFSQEVPCFMFKKLKIYILYFKVPPRDLFRSGTTSNAVQQSVEVIGLLCNDFVLHLIQ